ncbi:MAG: MBL fold metallo-hydrolase, partial [Caldilineales bacterium]|nr:MBL fold metallo-hydrolase [Caldilineales bacterium]
MPQFASLQSVLMGPIRVTYLPDGGGVASPAATFPPSGEAAWQAYADLLTPDGRLVTSIGAFLIEVEDRKILVDAGIGPVHLDFPGFGVYQGGRLLESLAQAGVAPDQITDVVFTHLHVDHVGWVTVEEHGRRRLTFPNARHLVSEVEWRFWYGGNNPAGPNPDTVQKPLAPVIQFVADGQEIAPGLRAMATPGHTPGHLSLVLDGGHQRLILIADLMYSPVQISQPTWSAAFDADPAQANATRLAIFHELTRPDTLTAAGHFAD